MDLDWDSTSIIGVRNSITSEDDDSPSHPLSLRGNPSERSFPGGLWEQRERCHLFRLGRDSCKSGSSVLVFGVESSALELLSHPYAKGSDMISKTLILKPKKCLGVGTFSNWCV